jgi:TRAP-type mannitol/chloroaromatic compound transport system substrate-binding protein
MEAHLECLNNHGLFNNSALLQKKGERKMKRSTLLLAFAAVTLLVLTATPGPAAEPQFKWKAEALWGPQETPYKMFEKLLQNIKVMTDGRLEITPFPAGSIVTVSDALDAVRNNVMQAMWMGPIYFSGKNPAFAAIGELSMAWEDPGELDTFMQKGGGMELLRELYKPFGVYSVGSIIYGMESYPSKKPLRKVEDFKGLKIRVPQGMEAEILTRIGAAVIVLPGTEVYSALDKGVIEATNWGTPSMNDKLGYHKIAPYFTYPGWHSMPVGDFSVREAEWNKLPADIKLILETSIRRFTWDLTQQTLMEDLEVVRQAKSKGATPIAWSSEEKYKMRVQSRKVWDDWKKKNPQTRKVIDAQEAFLKLLGRIE